MWYEPLLAALYGGLPASIVLMSGAFLVARRQQRFDFIDVVWCPGIFVATATAMIIGWGFDVFQLTTAQLIVLVAVLVWSTRLMNHVGSRFLASDKQDARYTAIIEAMPKARRGLHIYTRIYLLQTILAVTVSLAPLAAIWATSEATIWLAIGIMIWGIGLFIEHVGDQQLKTFIASKPKKGQLLRSGLWRYSRHPNYFGEIVVWWGIWMVSIGSVYWLVGLIGVLTISLLICFVSGVPQAEKRMQRKTGWEEYKRQTSVLIPWPPKQ